MVLFSIRCTTCRAKLKVRDESAIGEIFNCPKCGSMVQVVRPKDWPDDNPADSPASDSSSGFDLLSEPEKKSRWSQTPPNFRDIPPDAPHPADLAKTASHTYSSVIPKTKSPASDAVSRTEGESTPEQDDRRSASSSKLAPSASGTTTQANAAGQSGTDAAERGEMQDGDEPSIPTGPAWAAAGERVWQRRVTIALALLVVGLVAIIFINRPKSEPSNDPQPVANANENSDNADDVAPARIDNAVVPVTPSERKAFDPRWVPDEARFVLSLRLAELSGEPGFRVAIDHLDPLFQQTVGPLFATLELTAASIERFTYSTASRVDWPADAVIVLRLSEPLSDLERASDDLIELDWTLGGVPCYRTTHGDWPYPLAMPDERTIVTGPRELIEPLGHRKFAQWKSASIGTLLAQSDASRQAIVIVDASVPPASESDPAVETPAGWSMPVDLLMSIFADASEQDEWRALRDQAEGFAVTIAFDGQRLDVDTALAAADAPTAEQMRESLERMMGAMAERLKTVSIEQPSSTDTDSRTDGVSSRQDQFLTTARQALKNRETTTDGAVLWARTHIDPVPPEVVVAAIRSMPRLQTARIAAANRTNDARRTRLLEGLIEYADLEDGFPQGAAGAVQLDPNTRLSWIASLLPYLDGGAWYRELNFRRPWNDPRNEPVTRRPLEFVLNPLVPRAATDDGFPVTHYVGAGGVGPDAGMLPADDPRAGVFGYNRTTRMDMIGDGASQTIALLPVQESLGPWSSGGQATVRSLTARPYVNGPDGFGDGQKNGMLVAMADGSVAFISNDVDPDVLERLVTINGEEPVDLSAIERRPSPEEVVQDEDSPEEPAPEETTDVADPTAERNPTADDNEPHPEPVDERPERVIFTEQAIAERLATQLQEIDFRGVPLADFIDFIGRLTGLSLAFDLDALLAAGVTPEEPLGVHLQQVDVKTALSAALADFELTYEIVDGVLLITRPKQKRELITAVKYETADLAEAADSGVEPLANLIRTVVAPLTWRERGGRGFVVAAENGLTVHQTEVVHQQVADLIARLRALRRDAAGGGDSGKPLLGSRRRSANAKLLSPVTANFLAPTQIGSILRFVSEQTDTRLLLDTLALRQDERAARIETTLSVNQLTLAETLERLCEALDLTYRVRDERLIEITTRSAAAERPELAIYYVGDLLRDGAEPVMLAAEIKRNVAPGGWDEEPGSGVLYFDEPSACLLVWQPQPVQAEVERLLESKRSPTVPQPEPEANDK